ncbi:MAG: FecR domain-containing protein [Bryobacteraceae bacterium]|jgi:FecR protein
MKIFTRHVSRELAAYFDGELMRPTAAKVERHIGQCALCQAEYQQVQRGMAMVEQLPSVVAPDEIWQSIDVTLNAEPREKQIWQWALAATAVLVLVGIAYWRAGLGSGAQWDVVRLDGRPVVGAKYISGTGKIAPGEWMETDSSSRAGIKIGDIGSVEVEPNTRVRVVTAKPGEHRLALARGEIRAKISAPPRLFFVDTAAGTAVDLGCEYSLDTDENGTGLLRVTKGWVSFQWKGLESLVPAGASCHIRSRIGPGIPYFDDAPEALKQALAQGGDAALSTILGESRIRDTLTLWHLLSRVNPNERERVYDRIAALTPVPAGVSREQALRLDQETLKHWKEELAWTW